MIKYNLSDLTRIPSVGPATARILKKNGIRTISQLAELDSNHHLSQIMSSFPLVVTYAKAITSKQVIIKEEVKSAFDDLSNHNVYFFDTEYNPGGTKNGPYGMFLLGWMNRNGEVTQLFVDDPANEREILTEFRDWLVKEKPVLIAYGSRSADVPHLRNSFHRFNIPTQCLEDSFLDLYSDVLYTRNRHKQKIFLPVSGSTSIKHVSENLGHGRPNLKIMDGLGALYSYKKFLRKKMKRTKAKIKRELLAYHLEDLEMVRFVYERVKALWDKSF